MQKGEGMSWQWVGETVEAWSSGRNLWIDMKMEGCIPVRIGHVSLELHAKITRPIASL